MKKFWIITLALAAVTLVASCVTQKKKGQEVGWFKRGYHNLTSKYNYWFNADELFRLTVAKLEDQHTDNYNQLLDIYPYVATDPQSAKGDLDNVVKKASTGIALHRPGDFSDDCYTLIGQAQYVKHDFETAEATFRWVKDEYDPNKKTKKFRTPKQKKEAAKEKKKATEKKKKEKAKEVKKKKEIKEDAAKEKKKAYEAKKKAAEKRRKEAAKAKKKGKSVPKTTKSTPATPTTPVTTAPAPAVVEKPAPPVPTEEAVVGRNPYKKGLGRTAAYPLAMIWFARTLTEREKYEEAEFVLRDLYEDRFLPSNLRDELAVAEANLWIKQKKYDKALEPLAKAVELTSKKKDRARYAFILAQLYDRANQFENAFAAYETVLHSSPAYDMEFNARLHQIVAGWNNGQMSSAEANRTLEKMTKDSKNKDFQDQIYYTLATIALKDGLKKDAIAFLRQSLSYSKGNASQRAESYLLLADLYFESEDFVNAKSYYDSTITVLPTTDPRHKRASDYATNLTDIARLITTITANDSIVRVYGMSEGERKDLAKSIKKQQQDQAEAEAAAARNAQALKAQPGGTKAPPPLAGGAGVKPSSFYFYNDAYLKKGKKDFNKTWSDRKLEDNWRRSNRQQTSTSEEVASHTDSLGNEVVTDNDVNAIFKTLPQNEAELAAIRAATYEAMYTLGTLFRDKLQNSRRSASTLEELQSRYPDTLKHEKETWYYSYLDYNDLNNPPKAKYYYDKLTGKYPNSPYGRALTDPNFLNATKAREKELTVYYDSTFTIFQSGQYQTAFQRCTDAPRKYGSQNPLMAKFALLSALCVGNLQGNEAYCTALAEVIGRYPASAEATRAKEIARLLACKGFEVAEEPKNKTQIDDAFTREDDKLHYFIVSLTGDDIHLDDVKSAVSDYNREFHKTEQLRISNIFLGVNTDAPIVVIRKFDNKEQAMRYYKEVKDKKGFLGETDKKTYNKEFFAITQENYRRVLKNKTLEGYRTFFGDAYLK